MSINQVISLFLHFGLMTLLASLFLALVLRILVGVFSLLASPIYLLLHYSSTFHSKEFVIPQKGLKKLLSDVCGTIIFSILFDIGWRVVQKFLANPNKINDIVKHWQDNTSNTEAVATITMLSTICLLSYSKKTKDEVKSDEASKQEPDIWLDKMRAIKFPPPFDWL